MGIPSEELKVVPYELSYISTICPDCDCTLSIPRVHPSWYLSLHSWACPKCGQLCEIRSKEAYWTKDKILLAISADRFLDQQVFSAQKRLDTLLKKHDNIGIKFTNGSLTGKKNDLIIAQVFSTRTCKEGTNIWTGIEDDIETLLIHIGQYIGDINELIEKRKEKDDEKRMWEL